MIRNLLLALCLATSFVTGWLTPDADAKAIHVGVRAGVAVTYGATLDAGETDDPLVDATAWDTNTPYVEGQLVHRLGVYYYALENHSGSQPPSANWWTISKFYYIDASASSGTCAGHTDPTTAQSATNKCKDLVQVYDATVSGGSINAPRYSLILGKRGDVYDGHFALNQNDGSFHSLFIIGAWGDRGSARPTIQFSNNNGSYFTGTVVNMQRGNANLRNWIVDGKNISYYTLTAGTGTFTAGDSITGVSSGSVGTIYENPVNGQIAIVTSQPFTNNETIQTAGGAKTGTISSVRYLLGVTMSQANSRLYNAEVRNMNGGGVVMGTALTLGSGDNIRVRNNYVHDTMLVQAAGAGIDQGEGAGIKVTNNTACRNGNDVGGSRSHNMYVSYLTGNSLVARNFTCQFAGVPRGNYGLVIHGVNADLTVEDNYSLNDNNGFAVDSGYTAVETFDRITFQRNKSIGAGTLDWHVGGYAFFFTGLRDSDIRNNWSVDAELGGMEIYVQTGLVGVDDPVMTNTRIYGNTILMTAPGGSPSYWALRIQGALGSGIDIRNNIFANLSTLSNSYAVSKDAVTSDANLQLNNNLYYTPNSTNVVTWSGANVLTSGGIGAIRTAAAGTTGAEAAGAYGNPLFTNAAAYDLTLQAGSPAKLLGAPILSTDFRQVTRNAATPSAGAYE